MTVYDYLRYLRDKYPAWGYTDQGNEWYSKVIVTQPSIPAIDPCPDDVERYRGSIVNCMECNQNFLSYPVEDCQVKALNKKRLVTITIKTKPTADQIKQTVDAYRCNKYYNFGRG